MFSALVLAGALICGCGGGGGENTTTPPPVTPTAAAAPTIASFSNSGLQNGAVIVTPWLYDTGIRDPLHVGWVNADDCFADISGANSGLNKPDHQGDCLSEWISDSAVTSKSFTPNVASGALVWSDEFSNSGSSNVLPDAKNWTYDTGFRCCGNNEQEIYCAAGSATAPCDPNSPNAYLDTTGILHVMARNPTGTTYTSARLKSQGCSASIRAHRGAHEVAGEPRDVACVLAAGEQHQDLELAGVRRTGRDGAYQRQQSCALCGRNTSGV